MSKKLHECVEYIRASSADVGASLLLCAVSDSAAGLDDGYDADVNKAHLKPSLTKSDQQCTSTVKLKGLANLGNTCFFNAVLQNLRNTRELDAVLRQYVSSDHIVGLSAPVQYIDKLARGSSTALSPSGQLMLRLGNCGKLTQLMLSQFDVMNSSSSATGGGGGGGKQRTFVSPSALFNHICSNAPRFKGFQQQDSHELLRYLLDGLKQEEIKRLQRAILACFTAASADENTRCCVKDLNDEIKTQIKEFGNVAKHTFVDKVFGGVFISSILCHTCHVPTQIFEPFLDISLPIVDNVNLDESKSNQRPKKTTSASYVNQPAAEEHKAADAAAASEQPLSKHQRKKEQKAQKQSRRQQRRKSNLSQNKSTAATDNAAAEAGSGDDNNDSITDAKLQSVIQQDEQKDECSDPSLPASQELSVYAVGDLSGEEIADKLNGLQITGTEECRSSNDDGDAGEQVACTSAEANDDVDESSSDTDVVLSGNMSGQCDSMSSMDTIIASDDTDNKVIEGRTSDEGKLPELSDTIFCISIETPADNCDSMPCDVNHDKAYGEGKLTELSDVADGISPETPASNCDDSCAALSADCCDSAPCDVNSDEAYDEENPTELSDIVDSDCISVEVPVSNHVLVTTEYCSCTCDVNKDSTPTAASNDEDNDDNDGCYQSPVSPAAESNEMNWTLLTHNSDTISLSDSGFSADDNKSSSLSQDKQASTDSLADVVCDDGVTDEERQAAMLAAMDLLASHPSNQHADRQRPGLELSVEACLARFTDKETLSGANMIICENCICAAATAAGKDDRHNMVNSTGDHTSAKTTARIKRCATKQMLIFAPPAVLTLHLKRFEQVGPNLRKVNRHVEFCEYLDLAPYCSRLAEGLQNSGSPPRLMYSLYGLVEHSGTLRNGHYTAYVKLRSSETNSSCLEFLQSLSPSQMSVDQLVNNFRSLSLSAEQQHKQKDCSREVLCELTASYTDLQQRQNTQPASDGRWYHISDTSVTQVKLANVLRCQAYILFYERIP